VIRNATVANTTYTPSSTLWSIRNFVGRSAEENVSFSREARRMCDTALHQQVLGVTAPLKVTDVRLDVESTEIHVHVSWPHSSHRKELKAVLA
jgi:hypothetical protein